MSYDIYYDIVFPLYLPSSLIYGAHKHTNFMLGDYVQAEIGKKRIFGVIWGQTSHKRLDAIKNIHTIKPIICKSDVEPMSELMRYFVDWVSYYTLSNRGLVLRQAFPNKKFLTSSQTEKFYYLSTRLPTQSTKTVARVIACFDETDMIAHRLLVKQAKVNSKTLNAMCDNAYLIPVMKKIVKNETSLSKKILHKDITLLEEQQIAAKKIISTLHKKTFTCFLLDGITGSGKTEVYMQVIAKLLHAHKQVLVMVPEILLTPDLINRFEQYFNIKPISWHSSLTQKNKTDYWRQISTGEALLTIGTRSALFLPYKNLGLIVVDEEQDSSYKQEEIVVYHARDIAIKRASLQNIPIILASATPSIESYNNTKNERYTHVTLHNRYGQAQLPQIHIIDMNTENTPAGSYLSSTLKDAIHKQKQKNEQTLLFLNRRGFSPLILCTGCGFRFLCANCDSSLVEHQKKSLLMCHYCGAITSPPPSCPNCGHRDNIISCGAGVEKIAQEVKEFFPDYRYVIMSSDYNENITDMTDTINQIKNREIDIVIGTQLAAKGHNFPYLTLIGVIDGDMGMDTNDPRTNERCFQMLVQVAGRSGRGSSMGKVFIQSWYPHNPIIKALQTHDREKFYTQELMLRKKAQLPPFTRIAAIIISSPYADDAKQYAQTMRHRAAFNNDITLLGPAQAALFKLRKRYRYRILLRTHKINILQPYIQDMLNQLPKPASHIHVQIDIDPIQFL